MPLLLSTPESWFRVKQRDIYQLEHAEPEDPWKLSSDQVEKMEAQYRQNVKELRQWFRVNLPDTETHMLGPSEYSGYICGGPVMIVADFDEASRAAFEAHWPAGQPWRVRVHPYAEWEERMASARLLEAPSSPDVSCCWWDTPSGILLVSTGHDGRLLSEYDATWLLRQHHPELGWQGKTRDHPENGDMDEIWNDRPYPFGWYEARPQGQSYIVIGYLGNGWQGEQYANDCQRMRQLQEALGLPRDHGVSIVVNDI